MVSFFVHKGLAIIEKGKVLPNLDTIHLISLKLNVPLTFFVNLVYDDSFERIEPILLDSSARDVTGAKLRFRTKNHGEYDGVAYSGGGGLFY